MPDGSHTNHASAGTPGRSLSGRAGTGRVVVLAALLAGLLLPAHASALSWGTAVEAPLPADAASDPSVALTSVSCASAGECTAVGRYTGGSEGLLLTEMAGTWATGVEAPLPADAASYP